MPTITSGNITLIDLTDAKKIDVHIASNHPTVQVDDNGKYIPNWEQNNLELIATVYADSIDVTEQSKFQWKEITGIYPNEEERIFETNSNILTISDNKAFDKSSLVRYKCLVTYNEEKNNNRQFSNEITFARIDNGVSAPTVQARYSVDGNKANMEVALDPTVHKYIHFSYDGGFEWTEGVKIAGEQGKDGQSISLKGTAYTDDELVASGVVTLYSDEAKQIQIAGENSGDSYLVEGYLCVYNGSQFICTGQLQGPKGEDGTTYYLYIRYADNTSGSNFSDVPGNRKYVGFYRSTITPLPTNIDKSSATWNWAKFAGEDAKGITLTGNTQVFKVNKNNDVDPGKITITAQAENTSVTSWSYNTDGSTTFTNFTSSNPPTGISLSGNVVTITGSAMTSNLMTIKASDGTHSDIFTVYKVSDGSDGKAGDEGKPAPIAFLTNENISFAANASGQITGTTVYCNVVAYTGTTQVTPTVGTILSTELPTGMTIGAITTVSNQIQIPIVIANNATLGSAGNTNGVINIPITSPVSTTLQLTWSKINSGASASLVDITPSALYFKSTTGKGGTFTPEYIYLYPRFQNAVYSNWQYSIDGGVNWVAASGASGLSIASHNGVASSLRVSRSSTLYTDTVTSISFRCNSTTAGVYDTVTIAKIYDVVDLKIGGRNLLLDSGIPVTNSAYPIKVYNLTMEPVVGEEYTLSLKGTLGAGKTSFSAYNSGGSVAFGALTRVGTSDIYTLTFKWTNGALTKPTTINIYPMSASTVVPSTIEWIKLEYGNKATDWSPAPEDVDANIAKIDTKLIDGFAQVKTTTDSITSKATATEAEITTIKGNVSLLSTRVSTAEQKITPAAIVSTVRQSTDYTNDLGKKVGTTEIISKINQTAESITISANKIGLLGTTNIPDLTADKIKGGTLTLGGSNATTQNGQLLVKNASDANVVKLNKDGVIVKSGHLAVARDFTNQTYDWDTNTWTNSTNTSQLDLGDNFIRMGAYGASGYANSMTLLDDGLYFQGSAHAIGNWDSFVGHDDLGDFVIQETVRSNIYFRGAGDTEMAHISGNGLHVSGPISGGIANGNARLFTNVFVKNFPSQPTGYICVKLGSATLAQSSMITIKGHITSYHNSTSFEASCYFYNATGTFFGSVATMTNPDILREVYFAERNGYAYLILGAPNATWSYPTVAIDSLSVGYAGNTASEWTYGWDAVTYTNITSNFTKIAACTRGGLNTTLWTGAILSNTTITVSENIRNFKFLTCIMGDASSPWGITMGAFMDSDLTELHFGAIYTDANSIAGANLYGVRFNINSPTSLTMQACGTKSGGGAYMRKIVGWR